MEGSDIYGPYGAIVLLATAVIHLYRDNIAMRERSMKLLERIQERDEAERKLRLEEEAMARRERAEGSTTRSRT